MQCYFLRDGHIAGVEILPPNSPDEDAIVRAHVRAAKRKGPFAALEVWDGARLAFREPLYSTRCQEWVTRDLPRARLRQPQNDIASATALTRAAHSLETVDHVGGSHT
jgi:hypothetical protein